MTAVATSLLAGVAFGLSLAAPPGPMNAVIAEESVLRGWGAGFRAGLGAMSADVVFFLLALVGVVAVVERFPTLRAVMVGVGGILMLYFAYGAAREVGSSFRPGADRSGAGDGGPETVDGPPGQDDGPPGQDDGADGHDDGADGHDDRTRVGDGGTDTPGTAAGTTGFRKAFVLALTNPYQILFWLTIGVGLLEPGRLDVLGHTPYLGEALAGLVVVRTGSPALLVGFFAGIVCWITGFPAALVSAQRRVESFAPAVAGVSALVLAGFGVTFLLDAAETLW